MPSSLPKADPLSGRVGHLNVEQQHILGKFKKELAADGLYKPGPPPSHDDPTLLRFLRARKFDLAKAKHMFSDAERWRKEFDVDELYRTFDYQEKAEVDKVYPQYYHRTDKDGRPVYIEQLGNLDLTKLYKVTTPERQLQRLVVEYEKFLRERLPVCTAWRNDGERVETSCTIMDLNGVGISQFWKVKSYVQQATSIGQDRYPETMGKFYVINAPWAFTTVWSFVKPWLDEVTVRKINIVAHHDVKSTLLSQIDAASLPKQFGGTCNCPGGCSLSDAGPWKDVAEGRLKLDPEAAAAAGVPQSVLGGEASTEVGKPAPATPSKSGPPTPAKSSAPATPAKAAAAESPSKPSESTGSPAAADTLSRPERSSTTDSLKYGPNAPAVGSAPGDDSPATTGGSSNGVPHQIPPSHSADNLAIKRVQP